MNLERIAYGPTSGLPGNAGEVFLVDLRASSSGTLQNVAGERYYLQDGSNASRPPVMRISILTNLPAPFVSDAEAAATYFNAVDVNGSRVMQDVNCFHLVREGVPGIRRVPILQPFRLDPRQCWLYTTQRFDVIVPVYVEYAL